MKNRLYSNPLITMERKNYALMITATPVDKEVEVFSVEVDGTIYWNCDGKRKKCTTNKDLGLALAIALEATLSLNNDLQKKISDLKDNNLLPLPE